MPRMTIPQLGGGLTAPTVSSSGDSGIATLMGFMMGQQKQAQNLSMIPPGGVVTGISASKGPTITTPAAGVMEATKQGLSQATKDLLGSGGRDVDLVLKNLKIQFGAYKNVIAERKKYGRPLYGLTARMAEAIPEKLHASRKTQMLEPLRTTTLDTAAIYGRQLIPGSRAIRLVDMFGKSFPTAWSQPDEAMEKTRQSAALVLGNRWALKNGYLRARELHTGEAINLAMQQDDPDVRRVMLNEIDASSKDGQPLLDFERADGATGAYTAEELSALPGYNPDEIESVIGDIVGELPFRPEFRTTYIPDLPYSVKNLNRLSDKQLGELWKNYRSEETRKYIGNKRDIDFERAMAEVVNARKESYGKRKS